MEYLILVIEFFYVKGWKSFIWSFMMPVVIGVLVRQQCIQLVDPSIIENFHTNIITVLGILIGFTISTFTMLLTINGSIVEKAKKESMDKRIFSKDLTLYDSILIGLAYVIFVQGLLLTSNFIYPIFTDLSSSVGKTLFAINVAVLIHTILILIRSVLDFYFVITKR